MNNFEFTVNANYININNNILKDNLMQLDHIYNDKINNQMTQELNEISQMDIKDNK